jgi:hypothetical protein
MSIHEEEEGGAKWKEGRKEGRKGGKKEGRKVTFSRLAPRDKSPKSVDKVPAK